MSVDLYRSDKDAFFINNAGWRWVIAFANANGANWDDSMEQCSEASAKQFATAIFTGLADKSPSEISAELSVILESTAEFTDETRALWSELATFAERGAFQIWV